MKNKFPPLFTFVGSSGSGKTTFLENLIPVFTKKGFKVGAIKHDAHKFEIDKPGKDSYRLKSAGSRQVIISSKEKIALVKSVNRDMSVYELILKYFSDVDIILTEGYKKSNIPKFEIYRIEHGKEPLCFGDNHLVGIVTNSEVSIDKPIFGLSDYEKVADYIISIANFENVDVKVDCEDELVKRFLEEKISMVKFFKTVKNVKVKVEFD
ncbi:molybdopterin-guanine dinucleotide biosynthesis protein B [Deferribacter autotrophicus]|uniref:Molybdopterin-guanine dinucleotide biosynthesis protein B n=1 Tax=Deferribacter autotrophicus TaxID=500465 RepID=A0A5A8F466_9BACT|nr:molybdopterin-guanine dinucleotide biosynthesis protein B [Deferribacter autotrophicus]KAA0258934.1 molybdopterin-guanine dinucleotide biosynthesis protein B [Deferribacter autotrophicus]